MLLTLIVFLLILSVLVFVHEFGHFVVAKLFGIYVEEFGFGLPPRVWGKKIGETIYSINLLPIGGFVKLYGEEEAEDSSKVEEFEPRAFYNRPKWQRLVVLTAGVTMNFLLAIVVISYIFTQGVLVPTKEVHIEQVLAGTPAAQSGLQSGDIINTINGKRITSSGELIKTTRQYLGKPVRIAIMRKHPGGKMELSVVIVTPRKTYPSNQGPLGISISNLEEKRYSWYEAPIYGTREAIFMSWEMIKGISIVLWKLVTFAEVPKDVAGPVGIAQLTGQAVKFGIMAVLQLLGLLSLNLAIINILPIPALDGGRVLFVFLESIIGKKVRMRFERAAHQVGMIFLLSLFALVTLNDVMRIINTSGFGEQLKNLLPQLHL